MLNINSNKISQWSKASGRQKDVTGTELPAQPELPASQQGGDRALLPLKETFPTPWRITSILLFLKADNTIGWNPPSHCKREKFIVLLAEWRKKKAFELTSSSLMASSHPSAQQVLQFNCIISEMNGSVHGSQLQTSANIPALRLKQTLLHSHEGQM